MYVYRATYKEGVLSYQVGFYGPDGGIVDTWTPESDWSRQEEAARRVSWLNGGNGVHFDEIRCVYEG